MKNFGNKIDNDSTSAGVVVANEYNSIFNEAKSAVTPFLTLNELDNKQLAKSLDISSKAMFYNDIGAPNAVHLTRGATTEQIETLFDGMILFFSPANTNTGPSTLKLNGLLAKTIKFDNRILNAGDMSWGATYIAVYNLADDSFYINVVANNKYSSEFVHLKAESGYQKFPTGLILQWGSKTATAGGNNNIDVIFPIAFTYNCYNISILQLADVVDLETEYEPGSNYRNLVYQDFLLSAKPTTTGFDMRIVVNESGTVPHQRRIQWSAIGY